MKAAVLRASGGLDRIEVQDIPDPGQPGPGQIRIALHATSLNYHDLLVTNGGLPTADGRVLMSDGAGVVEAVGEGVAEFRPGDHVVSCFFPQWQDGLPRGPVGDLAGTPGDGIDGFAAHFSVRPATAFTHAPRGWNLYVPATTRLVKPRRGRNHYHRRRHRLTGAGRRRANQNRRHRLGAGHRRCFHRRAADREDDGCGGYRHLVV
jgi:hypothetical protein